MNIPFNNKTKSFRSIITIINPINPDLKIDIEALWDTGAATSTIPEYYAKLLQNFCMCDKIKKGKKNVFF